MHALLQAIVQNYFINHICFHLIKNVIRIMNVIKIWSLFPEQFELYATGHILQLLATKHAYKMFG